VQEGDSPSFVDVTASGTVTAGAGTFNADGNVLTAKRIDDPSKKLEIINDLDGNVQFRINGSTRLLLRHNQLVLLESGTQLSTGENEFRINAGEDTLFKFSSTKGAAWGPNAYAYGAMDTGLFRVSPGTLALGNGLQYNDSGSLNLTNLTASGTVKTGSYTVATLPTPSTGMRAQVTDSNRAAANNFGSTVIAAAGGTQYTVPVFYDGTDWIIA
jgi:hypothetical protein